MFLKGYFIKVYIGDTLQRKFNNRSWTVKFAIAGSAKNFKLKIDHSLMIQLEIFHVVVHAVLRCRMFSDVTLIASLNTQLENVLPCSDTGIYDHI